MAKRKIKTKTKIPSDGRDALQGQALVLQSVFREFGYGPIEPPILQPADVFLNLSGEDIRHRIYMFTDPGGEELCLRPELTIPTCRAYLDANPQARSSAKLCYDGVAFRYQGLGSGRPREFHQAGAEWIGGTDRAKADAEAMAVAVAACEAAGLTSYRLRMGDVGLFFALMQTLPMDEQWRGRLKRYLWRPDAFHALLDRLVDDNGATRAGPGHGLLHALSRLDEREARAALDDVLDLAQIAPVGGRSVDEIAERLLSQAAEARADALPRATAKLIEDYLQVNVPAAEAPKALRAFAKRAKIKLGAALTAYEKRLDALDKAGLPVDRIAFDADFGRNLEYYTGFVFELTVPGMGGQDQVAGGGRYDGLLKDLGAPRAVPAVGCMIRTERLAAAIARGGRR